MEFLVLFAVMFGIVYLFIGLIMSIFMEVGYRYQFYTEDYVYPPIDVYLKRLILWPKYVENGDTIAQRNERKSKEFFVKKFKVTYPIHTIFDPSPTISAYELIQINNVPFSILMNDYPGSNLKIGTPIYFNHEMWDGLSENLKVHFKIINQIVEI